MKKLFTLMVFLMGMSLYGQEMVITDWDNDMVQEYVKYDDEGNKIEEGHLVNGKYHGTITSYDSEGNIRLIARFKNGVRDGLWKYYNEEGQITHEIVYEDNKRLQASLTRYFE